MTHPKVQHYVPQFILRGFTRGKHKRFHAFDKRSGRVFQTTPKDVAAENSFYDVETAEGILTIEPALGNLETRTARVIEAIRKTRTIAGLHDEEKFALAVFIAVQYLRTRQFRSMLADFDRQFTARLEGMGFDPQQMANYKPLSNEEEVKALSISMIARGALDIAAILMNKDWILTYTRAAHPFMIGDNPITLHNERDFGFYGNIGFAVPGIEIYMPISESSSLYLTCRSNGDSFRESMQKLEEIRRSMGETEEVKRLTDRLSPMFHALQSGSPFLMSPANVLRHNSQQIASSERWVFSPTGDFALAEQMLRDHEHLRHGPRGKVG